MIFRKILPSTKNCVFWLKKIVFVDSSVNCRFASIVLFMLQISDAKNSPKKIQAFWFYCKNSWPRYFSVKSKNEILKVYQRITCIIQNLDNCGVLVFNCYLPELSSHRYSVIFSEDSEIFAFSAMFRAVPAEFNFDISELNWFSEEHFWTSLIQRWTLLASSKQAKAMKSAEKGVSSIIDVE